MKKISADKKANFRQICIGIVVINLVFAAILFKNLNWISISIFVCGNIFVFLYSFSEKKLTSVTFNPKDDSAILEFKSILNHKKEIKTPVQSLKYTYKKEAIARFLSGKTLTLFIDNKKVAKIQLDDNGWTEEHLDNLVNMLDSYNVERKIESNLKDEFPQGTYS